MRQGALLLLGVLLAMPARSVGAEWQVADGKVAHAVGIVSSDGGRAALEVRCRPGPDVRVIHPALAKLPVDHTDQRPGWRRTVALVLGWGLDLRRPDHHGWRSAWHRCRDRRDCLVAREAVVDSIVRHLKSDWSLFIRIEPPDELPVDLRVSLEASSKAIEAVCPVPATER